LKKTHAFAWVFLLRLRDVKEKPRERSD